MGWVGQGQHLFWWRILLCKIQPQIPPKKRILPPTAWRKRGFSFEKIARLADLSLNTIVKVENGVNTNPTIETLTKIAKALEVGVDDLIK